MAMEDDRNSVVSRAPEMTDGAGRATGNRVSLARLTLASAASAWPSVAESHTGATTPVLQRSQSWRALVTTGHEPAMRLPRTEQLGLAAASPGCDSASPGIAVLATVLYMDSKGRWMGS